MSKDRHLEGCAIMLQHSPAWLRSFAEYQQLQMQQQQQQQDDVITQVQGLSRNKGIFMQNGGDEETKRAGLSQSPSTMQPHDI